MAAYDLEEQEQIAEVRAWWKQYGNLLLNVVTVVAVTAAAWQGWNWYQRKQGAEASAVYAELQNAAQQSDLQRVKVTSGELLEKYSGSSYAPLAALTAAKTLADNGDAKTARLQLTWAADKGKNEVRDMARLRLAALLIDEKEYDAALKQLDAKPGAGFEARFADTRGDVLRAQGKVAEAATAYRAAIEALKATPVDAADLQSWQQQSNAVFRELLQQKIDALGGAQ